MAIDFELLKDIKARADIVDVISAYLPSVQKKGRNYVAVCPFHDDHDPSMQISKEKQIFKCYVCNTGGDVFSFVQNYDKCSFEQAVLKVCEIINFDHPGLHKQNYVKKIDTNIVPLYNCINELQKFYVYGLSTDEGKIARDYLDNRDISIDQRNKFSLGYSLLDGKKTIEFLKTKSFSLKNIEDIGIALAQTNGMSDHNCGRLIFPIKDSDGQVIGFSARKINNNDDAPKYVNSPETKIFTKGNILYNYHNAKQSARHDGFIYVVEGFMDVFALDSIGINSAVALMSTKLTKQHCELLRKLGVEIRLCLDGDKPGQEAMMKIMGQLDEAHLKYRIVSKPGEVRDPDEILKQDGKEVLTEFVSTLVDPFNFAINYYQNFSPLGSIDDRKKVVNHFLPHILSLQSKIEYEDCIFKLSQVTDFTPQAIKETLKDYAKSQNKNSNLHTEVYEIKPEFPSVEKDYIRIEKAERIVLMQMLNSKPAYEYFEKNIKYFFTEEYRQISNFIGEYFEKNNEISPSQLITFVNSYDKKENNKILNVLSAISLVKEQPVFDLEALQDCKNAIEDERDKISSRSQLRQALVGKTPQDKARLAGDYIAQTNVKRK